MNPNLPEPKTARPVHEIRLGLIKAAIWANPTREGVMHNVTFERSYRDGDEWRTTASFGRDDLLKLAKVADQAHSWITQQTARKTAKPALTQGTLPRTGGVRTPARAAA